MPVEGFVEITVYWGHDDAESTIKLSPRKWEEIKAGAQFQKSAWSYYEGQRYRVFWCFADSEVTIDGADGRQCVVDLPVEVLMVTPISK